MRAMLSIVLWGLLVPVSHASERMSLDRPAIDHGRAARSGTGESPDSGTPRPGSTTPTPIPKSPPNWANSGGNALHNALSGEVGPTFFDPLWLVWNYSYISWQPLIEGNTVYVVRQHGSPGTPSDSPVVALDLDTGVERWRADVPYEESDWITALLGVHDGRVYASRGSFGQYSAPLYALDAATGATLWVAAEEITAGIYDGLVFARNGDLILGDHFAVKRIRAVDGTTVWSRPRQCAGPCAVALAGDALYATDQSTYPLRLHRLDVRTGADRYESAPLPAYAAKNTPMVGLDGTVYLVQDGSMYAFHDDGSSLTIRWVVPALDTFVAESAVGPDGSVYVVGPDRTIRRLDPATGVTRDASMVLPIDNIPAGSRFAVDRNGTVFFSTGGTSYGNGLYAFSPDLQPLWDTPIVWPNIGGPALGPKGTLVMSGIEGIRAFRPDPCGDGRCALGRTAGGRCIPGYFCDTYISVGQSQAGWLSFDPRKLQGFEVCGVDLVFRQRDTTNPWYFPLAIGIYDVSTPFEELNVTRVPIDPRGEEIAQDLCTGSMYGLSFVPAEDGEVQRIPLPGITADLQGAVDREDAHFSVGLANIQFHYPGYFTPEAASLDVVTCGP